MGNNRTLKFNILFCILLLSANIINGNPTKDENITHGHSQEYFEGLKTEGNKVKTVVHIIAHSHDDVGWLKTLDHYFWGIHDNIQRANVFLILDSVITELELNPERKFTEVEMAFFMRLASLINSIDGGSIKLPKRKKLLRI